MSNDVLRDEEVWYELEWSLKGPAVFEEDWYTLGAEYRTDTEASGRRKLAEVRAQHQDTWDTRIIRKTLVTEVLHG